MIIQSAWRKKLFSSAWKARMTVLSYKKGDKNKPENFRPITLQPTLSKVFTSIIRNRLFTYVVNNNYIETHIQKGFWNDISGCVEHTEILSHVINNARLKQKSVTITLIDLQNAFGEVNHELLHQILKLHHVPPEVITLIKSLYTNYHISILTDDFQTSPIHVKRGVLQGDSLSPLLFNLIINSLIHTIKNEKVSCLGYVYQGCLTPKHWFQFADDTAIVTSSESDNQLLCNVFLKWSTWADLIIKIGKCETFGIKKVRSKSMQFLPYITIRKEHISS